MKALFRAIAASAVLAAAVLSTASAQAASLFKSSGRTSIEVHADARRIFYLHLDVPVTCTSGSSRQEIADTRTPIRLDRETGAFSFVDVFRKGSEYDKAVVRGTIRGGRLRGEYEFGSTTGPGQVCWSGEAARGTPEEPQGSPVRLSLTRRRGLRFFEDSHPKQRRSATTYLPGSFSPVVYMWIGNGKAYALTAIVNETCVTHQAGFPPSRNRYDLVLTRRRTAVNRRTHEIHVREVERTGSGRGDRQVWTLSADVGRREVSGHLSHTYDYTYAGGGDTLHCQTGGRADPKVDFAAFHR